MTLSILLFIAGFYVLVRGANFLVDGASSIARLFHISNFVVGLVIVGIGTSIPEFAISFIANLTGASDIGFGTIVGSNTFNIFFILGLTAAAFTLRLHPIWVERDLKWNMLAVATAVIFAFSLGNGGISRLEAAVMLGLFLLWLYVTIKKTNNVVDDEKPIRVIAFPLAFGLMLAGLLGIFLGGKWVVDGAEVLARALGMSEALIGLTVVGLGTSLPELAVTFVAAYRDRPGIAIGNIIGSNIFDFLVILGVSALARPVFVAPGFFTDAVITLLASALLYGFMFVGTPYILKRWQGLVFVFLYIVYLFYIIGRG
ncbi:MAG: calcium/sodium antiporter [Candidatus Sungiibacteriota bacterium]|uniref:Calcium/sodium antiporter n=1 Tax=Candidatus Sungiibacteriota bacterium TaxID=2750080 RepID=A0A7T5UQ87_9BACT|nr:MAG: calcium/sodium antiporter [Candidatus Sungbacteria bacterium]